MAHKTRTKKPRNRAAQDATLVNLRALKRRVAALERAVAKHLTSNAKAWKDWRRAMADYRRRTRKGR